jgi:WhiB family redox-sensing transcriptional regulator
VESIALPAEYVEFTDKVIAFHQYKHELDLTQLDARRHPDTLEAFENIYETVAQNPSLVDDFTGVLRNRGNRRDLAIARVRAVEMDIASGLNDLGVISNDRFQREKQLVLDDGEIKKRSEKFVKLFKGVIPVGKLPKPKPKKRIQANNSEIPEQKSDDATSVTSEQVTPHNIEGLRKGQGPALDSLFAYVENKGMNNLEGYIVAPTGSGKTVIFAKFLEQLRHQERLPSTVIVVPTTQLKSQTAEELKEQGFKGSIQLAHTTKAHDKSADVVIITQQGFARQLHSGGRSLDAERIGLVIFDEAHHIGGERTKEAIQARLPHAGIIGFTASPDYDEKRLLAHHLPDLVHEITTDEAVEWNLIAPYQTILLPTHGNLGSVVPVGKDYHQYLLDRATNTSPRNHLVARFIVDHFMDKLTVVNVNTVAHAEQLAETIRSYGKETLAVSGTTKNLDRVLEAFHNRVFSGLVHARVLTEGFNEVSVEAVVNAVPTLSEVREKQRVGRGQRIDPANPEKVLKIVECVDDHYVRKPVLYGRLTGRWLYGGDRHISPFDPVNGYRVLQDPHEIDEWWAGQIALPEADFTALEKRASNYRPANMPELPKPKETVISLDTERRKRLKKSHAIKNDMLTSRRTRNEEFQDAFEVGDQEDKVESLRQTDNPAIQFIVVGNNPASVTKHELRNALKALAGHSILGDTEVLGRYRQLQEVYAEARYHNPDIIRLTKIANFFIEDLVASKPEWHEFAKCLKTPNLSFYPGRGESTKALKEVCAECAVKDICLDTALKDKEKFGIWGGLSEKQRRNVRRAQVQGATVEEVKVMVAELRKDVSPDTDEEFEEEAEQSYEEVSA